MISFEFTWTEYCIQHQIGDDSQSDVHWNLDAADSEQWVQWMGGACFVDGPICSHWHGCGIPIKRTVPYKMSLLNHVQFSVRACHTVVCGPQSHEQKDNNAGINPLTTGPD